MIINPVSFPLILQTFRSASTISKIYMNEENNKEFFYLKKKVHSDEFYGIKLYFKSLEVKNFVDRNERQIV